MNSPEDFNIPGSVSVVVGNGGMTKLMIESTHSTAELYLHGAHITHFQKHGEEPLLFLSSRSDYLRNKPIRGGVPVIFPWFGARENSAFHGFARLTEWELVETSVLEEGVVRVHLRLPTMAAAQVDYIVTVSDALTMELRVTCTGERIFTFENCLHSYFVVGDISRAEVHGLQHCVYRDQLLGRQLTDDEPCIVFGAETDRIYQHTGALVTIVDPVLQRCVQISKSGSESTVVWNPWIDKSQRMPDFGDHEYLGMVCVESGNVREYAVNIARGETASLQVCIQSAPLA